MSKTRIAVVIILSVLIVGTLAFIWGNSVLPKEESAEVSSTVYEEVEPVLDTVLGEGTVDEFSFRKLAHFSEFFLLGFETMLLVLTLKGLKILPLIIALPAGLVVGAIDETIQIFSERGPAVKDVFIDFTGYFCAFFLFFIVAVIGFFIKKKTKKS